MRDIADALVFDLGWQPADLQALTPAEILYWYDRAVVKAKKRKASR